ncbi:hypothetical protein KB976_005024 [Vibrio parahaemolyticus]|nr:hypothetical protein [Vibrio parahaemolyticus]
MILGNRSKFKGKGYVCFIDVLGFSDDILSNWDKVENNPLDKLLSIKSQMPVFDESGSENDALRRYVCKVNTVSDSVTICFGFEKNLIVGDLVLGLEAVIANIAYIWSTFIQEGYTIRGAIDFGDIYWDENEIIGPSFINAYSLESKVAKTSRVIVSSDLNKLLGDLYKQPLNPLTEHLTRNFTKDIDGYISVDPNVIYSSDEERVFLLHRLLAMRDAVKSPIVKEKYTPLIHTLTEAVAPRLRPEEYGKY